MGERVERLRDVIRFGSRSGFNTLTDQDRLQMAWVVVCGRVMAERAQVSGYEDGIVKIAVQERAWLEEMRGMSSHLEGELSRVAGLKVSKLHFIVKR